MAEAPAVEFSAEITELADKLVALTVKDAQALVDCLKNVHGIEPAGGKICFRGRYRSQQVVCQIRQERRPGDS